MAKHDICMNEPQQLKKNAYSFNISLLYIISLGHVPRVEGR